MSGQFDFHNLPKELKDLKNRLEALQPKEESELYLFTQLLFSTLVNIVGGIHDDIYLRLGNCVDCWDKRK